METDPQPTIIPYKQATKELLTVISPVVLARLLETAGLIVNSIYLAKIGEDALAASGLITPVNLSVINGLKFFVYSVNYWAARALRDKLRLTQLLRMSLLYSLSVSTISIIFSLNIHHILNGLGQNRDVVANVATYYKAYSIGIPAIFLLATLQQYCIGTKHNHLVPISSLLQQVTSISLGYCLAFGAGKLPASGIAGIGYAGAVSYWIGLISITIGLVIHKVPFSLRGWNKNDLIALRDLVKKGAPIGIFALNELGGILMLSLLIGNIGKNPLIAYEIITQAGSFFTTPLYAMSPTTGGLIARYINAKRYTSAKRIGNTSILLSQIIPVLYLLILSLSYREIAKIYNIHPNTTKNIAILNFMGKFVWIYGANMFPDGIRNVSFGGLAGMLITQYSMWVSLGSMALVNIPAMFLLRYLFQAPGAVVGRGLGISANAGLMIWGWVRKSKQLVTNSLTEEPDEEASTGDNAPLIPVNAQRLNQTI